MYIYNVRVCVKNVYVYVYVIITAPLLAMLHTARIALPVCSTHAWPPAIRMTRRRAVIAISSIIEFVVVKIHLTKIPSEFGYLIEYF